MSNEIEVANCVLDALVCQARENPRRVAVAILESVDALRSLRIVAETDVRRLELFLARLRDARVPVSEIDTLRKVLRSRPLESSDDKSEDLIASVRVIDVLHDAPVAGEVIVPYGWTLTDRGIHSHDGSEVLRVPLVIASRFLPLDESGAHSVALAWRLDGRWTLATVDRVVMASASRLVQLADRGLPITWKKAQALVEFLEAFDHTNRRYTHVVRTASCAGWMQDGRGFLWGERCLSAGDGPDGVPVVLAGDDGGSRQALLAMRSAGSFECWADAVAQAVTRPRIGFALYAGLVPPLLRVVDARSFAIDISGPTSKGKTTLLRLVASLWGDPDETSSTPYLRGWDLTRTFVERLGTLYADHPLLLDDTQRANPKLIERLISDVAGGQGRGRATASGIQESGTWRTVLFSTGERPLTAFTTAGGVRGRVIPFWGSPFNESDAEAVRQLNSAVMQNFGHAGPMFVRFLVDHREQWNEWRDQHRAMRDQISHATVGNPVADRHADYLASVRLVAVLAHQALHLPWPYVDPVEGVLPELAAGWTRADETERALDHLRAWLAKNQHRFLGQGRANGRWLGRWESTSEYIDVLPFELKAALARGGYSYDACIRAWASADVLVLDSSGRRQVPVKLGKVTVRAVRMRKSVLGIEVLPTDDGEVSEITSASDSAAVTLPPSGTSSGWLQRMRALLP